MISLTDIDVDPAALDEAHLQVLTSAGRISGLLDALASFLAPMQATWTGAAAEAADDAIAAWNTSATALNELLTQIGGALDSVGENYAATETGTAGIWQV